MKIKVKANKQKIRTNYYSVEIETMEGDDDDSHEVRIDFENNENGLKLLRECIIACEVISKHYPYGGYRNYQNCPYWMKWFDFDSEVYDSKDVSSHEDWYWECNSGTPDSFENYCVYYYDNEGIKNECKITFDNDMIKEIADANILEDI